METKRFVVQKHTTSTGQHWDFMLEYGDVLATWQIGINPGEWPGRMIECSRIFDHRLKYLDYEGAISGDRGSVSIALAGNYHPIKCEDQLWEIEMTGGICGTITLTFIENDRWLMGLNGVIPIQE